MMSVPRYRCGTDPRWRRLPAVVLSLALLAGLPVVAPVAQAATKSSVDERIRQQQRKLHAVKEQLQQKRAQLGEARAKVGSLQDQLATTDRNIAAVQARLETLGAGISSTERKLAWNKLQLAAAQKTLERHNDALRRRLIDAYENGDLSYLAVLLQSSSFGDFVERWNDIRYVIRANEATIRQRKADAERVAAIQSSLLADEAALHSAQDAAEQQKR